MDSIKGLALNDVGEIMFNVNGHSSSTSGYFNVDNIRLGLNETIIDSF